MCEREIEEMEDVLWISWRERKDRRKGMDGARELTIPNATLLYNHQAPTIPILIPLLIHGWRPTICNSMSLLQHNKSLYSWDRIILG